MPAHRRRFNRVSVSAMAELRDLCTDPMTDGHDACPSWESIATETVTGGQRSLLRCTSDGGFAWLQIDKDGKASGATRVEDQEAREIWPRVILQFTPEEKTNLDRELQPGALLEKALKSAFGSRRIIRSIFLKDRTQDDGTTRRQCLIRNGGIVRADIDDSDQIVRKEVITGSQAWSLIQHFIDP